jgi:hypothetical protein
MIADEIDSDQRTEYEPSDQIRRLGSRIRLVLFIAAAGYVLAAVAGILIAILPITRSDLIGTYRTENGAAVETLVLNADGTLVQEARLKYSSEVLTAKGIWSYDESRQISLGGGYVSTQPLSYFHTWDGQLTADVDLPVLRTWTCQIQIGEDEWVPYGGTVYRKLTSR